MSAAAMKITEAAKDLQEAVTPSFSKEDLRRILTDLEAIAHVDPREAFGHSIGEQRKGAALLDETIAALNFIGTPAMHSAEADADLNRKLQKAIRAACKNLRITRALMSMLAGEKALDEQPEILDEVQRLVAERSSANLASLDEEERSALHVVNEDSSDLERWLSEP